MPKKIQSRAVKSSDHPIHKRDHLKLSQGKAFVFVSLISINSLIFFAQQSNLIPNKLLLASLIILNGLLLLTYKVISLVKKPILKRALNVLTCLTVLFISIATNQYLQSTTHFVDTISSVKAQKNKTYILARKTDIIANQTMISGLMHGDVANKQLLINIAPTDSYKTVGYPDLSQLIEAISNNQIDTITLPRSMYQLVEENYPDTYKTLKLEKTIEIPEESSPPSAQLDITKPFIIYISGIDTYGSIDITSRSDVNILAVVNPRDHKLLLVNTPRDYYVHLNGTGDVTRDKLTHAGLYGIDSSMRTLEELYSTKIDSYVRINFTSYNKIIDALGEIEVYSEHDFRTSKFSYTSGFNTLNGAEALEFARARYQFSDGDRTRGKNQQKVIEALVAKANSPGC